MEQSIIYGLVGGIFVTYFFCMLYMLMKMFFTVPSGHVLVINQSGSQGGQGRLFRTLLKGKAISIPVLQRAVTYPIEIGSVASRSLVITKEGRPFLECDLDMQVTVKENPDSLERYITLFGAYGATEI
ncbi:hypothetical protein KJ865_04125, partial [Myxococcota bacterium]|nr:hypothetical protein [Myxococcota bacterium]